MGQVELLGGQGLRQVKTRALLFVGTKETKECGKQSLKDGGKPVEGTALRAVCSTESTQILHHFILSDGL